MKPVIYQLMVRLAGNRNIAMKPFGSIQENGCGKFNDLDLHFLKSLRNFGISHLWLTGIIEHATCTDYSRFGIKPDNPFLIKGMAGSPYAIKDYYDVCPDLAVSVEKRMQEFEALIARCHEAGLKPIIDFVPNHVARQYGSDQKPEFIADLGQNDHNDTQFAPDNNFYYIPEQTLHLPPEIYSLPYIKELKPTAYVESPAKATGNNQFSHFVAYNDWYETVKLNYGVDYFDGQKKYFEPVPDTWRKMTDILLFWASKGVSGFRCDMAELVPVEFWEYATKIIKDKHPEMIFIAEVYNPRAYRTHIEKGGFDFLYDKDGFYDTIRDILVGNKPAGELTRVWQNLDGLDNCMLRFIENHDEQRIASSQFAGSPLPGIPAMAVAATMQNGPLMLYFGQEVGEAASGAAGFSGDDGRTTIFDYYHVPAFGKWFNNGKCNEEQLSENQKALRNAYAEILKLCLEPVISSGNFYDLMWYNQHLKTAGKDKLYAFLRWNQSTIWIVAANFNQNYSEKFCIKVPEHFSRIANFDFNQKLFAENVAGQSVIPASISLNELAETGIEVFIGSMNYVAIRFNR